MDDPFQEAEYASGAALAPLRREAVMIHGGMDVLPPVLASTVCPAEHRILCVRVVNAGVQVLTYAVFAGLVVVFAAGHWIAALPAVIVLAVLGGIAVSPVQVQQSAPGVRDLVALLALWPMLHVSRAIDGRRRPGSWAFAALGVLAGAAPFWAYNRGLLLVAVAGAFVLGVCVVRRTAWPACWAVAGGAAAVLAAPLFGAEIGSTAANIAYWARNGGIWSHPASLMQLLPTAAFHAMAAGLACLAAVAAWREGRRGWVLLLGSLALTAALYLVQSLGRVDAEHMRWTLWPSLLLLAAGMAHLVGPGNRLPLPRVVAGGALAVCALTALRFMDPLKAGWGGLPANLRLLAGAAAPDDAAIAGPDLVRVAGLVRGAGRCAFAADNAAMVHLLSGAPPCSRFPFGSYIAPSEQAGVIGELQAGDPAVILWDAPFWWARVDKVPLSERLPALGGWIVANYPVVTVLGVHTIRTKGAVAE